MMTERLLHALLIAAALTSPVLADMAAAPVAAPAMSPLSLTGLAALLGVVGIRVLNNRRQR